MLGIWVKFDRIIYCFFRVLSVFFGILSSTENGFLFLENLQTQQRVFQQNQPYPAIVILCCARTQRGDCCSCGKFGAATQFENRPFTKAVANQDSKFTNCGGSYEARKDYALLTATASSASWTSFVADLPPLEQRLHPLFRFQKSDDIPSRQVVSEIE